MKRAGISSTPKFGNWQLTTEGQKFAAETPVLTLEQVQVLVLVSNKASLGYNKAADGTELAPMEAVEAPTPTKMNESPEERLESAVSELSESVQVELLEAIMGNSPVFFERLVLDVLHAMDYGMSRKDIDQVGKSNDGG